jgi:hypothetical protein
MAQQQPWSGAGQAGSQPRPLSDLFYDLATVVSNCGQATEVLKQYIEDARKENNQDAVRLFEHIRQNELRHGEMAAEVMTNLAKQGKL